jgi:hypothetical protein
MGKCYINGPDGSRREIAIHGGCPVGAIGCLTTYTANYGNRKSQKTDKMVIQIIENIPDPEGFKRCYFNVVKRRIVKNKDYGLEL